MDGACNMHDMDEMENIKRKDHLEDLGLNGRIILEWILRMQGGKKWTGCMWLRIGTSGRPL
jgi:hypothetical protein